MLSFTQATSVILSLLLLLPLSCSNNPDRRVYDAPDDDGDGFNNSVDCAISDPSKWQVSQLYTDTDNDGYGAGNAKAVCHGEEIAKGWSYKADDCAPEDSDRWQSLPYGAIDMDADGYHIKQSDHICTGDSLPTGYHPATAELSSYQDCDDQDSKVHLVQEAYIDTDGDGYGSELVTICTSGSLPIGYADQGGDCAPDNPLVWRWVKFAGRDEVCSFLPALNEAEHQEIGAKDTDIDVLIWILD